MTHVYPKKDTKGIHYLFTVGPLAFGNLLFGTFLLSLCLPLLLERERKVRFLCRRTESRPKLMVIALCIVASSCCRHASTSYDVMHVDSLVACICNWLLRRPSSSYASLPFLSLLTQLKTEEHAERRRAEMGGRGTGEKRRPIQVASTETDGQADRQWEEERERGRETSQ